MTYRVFTNDVGPNAYSALCDITASNQDQACQRAARRAQRFAPVKVLAMPENKRSDWPNGQTGRIKPGVFDDYGIEVRVA